MPYVCYSNAAANFVDDIVVVNKPSGLAVHAGPKLCNDLSHYRHYWQYELTEPPELAHRLDKLGTHF